MPVDGGPGQLYLALANLIQRLHYALGAYDEPLPEDVGLVDHTIVLPGRGEADDLHQDLLAAGFAVHPLEQSPSVAECTMTVTTTQPRPDLTSQQPSPPSKRSPGSVAAVTAAGVVLAACPAARAAARLCR